MTHPIVSLVWQINLELSLLIALILIARWSLKRTVKLYNAYWLWLALPLAPLVMLLATNIATSTVLGETVSQFFAPAPSTDNSLIPLINNIKSSGLATNEQVVLQQQNNSANSAYLIFAWMTGALFFLTRLIRQHRSLCKELTKADYQESINLISAYPIQGVSKEGFSPAVYGFLRPTIYFPLTVFNDLNHQQRALIVKHEEQHIRHGHLWLNLVWDILICLTWFNPIIYFARRTFRHDQELFCDYLVLKNTDASNRQAYGHALISTVSATHSVSLLCSWKMFDQLEERIMNIKSKHPIFKQLLTYAALISVLSITSIYAIASEKESKEKAKSMRVIKIDKGTENANNANSIRIIKINEDGEQNIVIKTGGKTFRMEGDERYILEDGKRRAMTDDETQEFNKLVQQSKEYANASGDNKGKIFDQEKVHSFTTNDVLNLDFSRLGLDEFELEDMVIKKIELARLGDSATSKIEARELEKVLSELKGIDLDDVNVMRWSSDQHHSQQRRINRALRETQQSKVVAVRKVRKQLKETQEKMAASRKQLQVQQEAAMKQLKELQKFSNDKAANQGNSNSG